MLAGRFRGTSQKVNLHKFVIMPTTCMDVEIVAQGRSMLAPLLVRTLR